MVVFLVVGRLGKSLTVSKAEPFLALRKVSRVYIFRQDAGYPIDNAVYITLPRWIKHIKPSFASNILRAFYEPLQVMYYSWKIRPVLINGVFTLPKGLNSVIAGKLTNTPSVVSVIGGIVEITTRYRFQRFWEGINLWMLKTCTAVTTKGNVVSSYLLKKGVKKEKVFILNGSINTNKFCFDPSIEKDIDILFVGTFRPLKGPDRVVEVIDALRETFSDLKAVMIGDGEMRPLIQDKIKERNLIKNIDIPGYIDHPEKIFQRAKCILITSESEGLPTCMLEAMACGCVPIVSDVGNIKDAAKHEVNAMVVPDFKDVSCFTKFTRLLLTNESLRSPMAKKAINTVQNYYSTNKQSEIASQIIDYCKL